MSRKYTYIISFLLGAGGFLWPLWPLCALAVAFAALSGRWVSAILLGMLLDVAWGVPSGILRYVYLPFTLLATVSSLLRYFFAGYFLDRTPPDTL